MQPAQCLAVRLGLPPATLPLTLNPPSALRQARVQLPLEEGREGKGSCYMCFISPHNSSTGCSGACFCRWGD